MTFWLVPDLMAAQDGSSGDCTSAQPTEIGTAKKGTVESGPVEIEAAQIVQEDVAMAGTRVSHVHAKGNRILGPTSNRRMWALEWTMKVLVYHFTFQAPWAIFRLH
jgi:hypothetical protein